MAGAHAGGADRSPTARTQRFCSKWELGGCAADRSTHEFRNMSHEWSIHDGPDVTIGTCPERVAGESNGACVFGTSQAARTVSCARHGRPSARHVSVGFGHPHDARGPPPQDLPVQTHHYASREMARGRGLARERAKASPWVGASKAEGTAATSRDAVEKAECV